MIVSSRLTPECRVQFIGYGKTGLAKRNAS